MLDKSATCFVWLALVLLRVGSAVGEEGASADGKLSPSPENLIWVPASSAVVHAASKRPSDPYYCVSFLPKGEKLVCTTQAGTVVILNAKDLTLVSSFKTDGQYYVPGVSPDGTKLAVVANRNSLRVVSVDGQQTEFQLEGHSESISRIAWSPDGKWIASGDSDGLFRIWNVETRQEFVHQNVDSQFICCLQFSPNSKTLAIRTQGETLLFWDMDRLQEGQRMTGQGVNSNTIAFSNDSSMWATLSDWETMSIRRTSDNASFFSFKARWSNVAWAPNGSYLAVSSEGEIHLLNPMTGDLVHSFSCTPSWIASFVFSPDSNALAVIDGKGNIAVWDVSIIDSLKRATKPPVDDAATINGRYSQLIQVFDSPKDHETFGDSSEFGFRKGEDFSSDGYWVYHNRKWYVFAQRRIGLGSPPKVLPKPSKRDGKYFIWLALPNSICASSGIEAAEELPKKQPAIRQAKLTYNHRFQFKDEVRQVCPTAVLEVCVDESQSTEEVLSMIQKAGWHLQVAELLNEAEARSAGLFDSH